jgi:hypothetical protein
VCNIVHKSPPNWCKRCPAPTFCRSLVVTLYQSLGFWSCSFCAESINWEVQKHLCKHFLWTVHLVYIVFWEEGIFRSRQCTQTRTNNLTPQTLMRDNPQILMHNHKHRIPMRPKLLTPTLHMPHKLQIPTPLSLDLLAG